MLWLDLQAAKRELDIQTVIADGDPIKRAAMVRALTERLELERRALAKMQR